MPNDPVPDLPTRCNGLTQLLETWHWHWLAKMPRDLAEPVGLLFLLDDEPAGLAYCQIEGSASGIDARIVHVQCIDAAICAWVIAATTEFLVERGAGFIRCCVSSDQKTAALERVGFIKSQDFLCYWLPGASPSPPPTSVDVSNLRGDDAIPFHALRGRTRGQHVQR